MVCICVLLDDPYCKNQCSVARVSLGPVQLRRNRTDQLPVFSNCASLSPRQVAFFDKSVQAEVRHFLEIWAWYIHEISRIGMHTPHMPLHIRAM